MIEITPAARRRALRYLGRDGGGTGGDSASRALRLGLRASDAPGFELTLVPADAPGADRVVEDEGFRIFVDPVVSEQLEAAVIDFEESGEGAGFVVRPVYADPTAIALLVRKEVEDNVNPMLAAHGGSVRVVGVRDGVARVTMEGGCQGCSAARLTLKGIVERMIRSRVPGIRAVEDVTDHDAGRDPYLAPAARNPVSRAGAA